MTNTETFKELAELTDVNAHTEAYIKGCEFLIENYGADLSHEAGCLRGIFARHMEHGSLSYELGQRRYRYYQTMMTEASTLLPAEDYKLFYQCF